MSAHFRRCVSLLLMCLLPLLACADPGSALAAAAVLELVIALVALLASGLAIWSLMQPARQALFWVQLVFWVLSLLLGLLTFDLHEHWPLTGPLDPLWYFAIPLGGWRTGLRLARQHGPTALGVGGLGIAYFALHFLLRLLLGPLGQWLDWEGFYVYYALLDPRSLLVFAITAAGAWLVLSGQLRLAYWLKSARSWWQLLAVTAAVGLSFLGGYWLLFTTLHRFDGMVPAWDRLVLRFMIAVVVNWAVGAAVLRWRGRAALPA